MSIYGDISASLLTLFFIQYYSSTVEQQLPPSRFQLYIASTRWIRVYQYVERHLAYRQEEENGTVHGKQKPKKEDEDAARTHDREW